MMHCMGVNTLLHGTIYNGTLCYHDNTHVHHPAVKAISDIGRSQLSSVSKMSYVNQLSKVVFLAVRVFKCYTSSLNIMLKINNVIIHHAHNIDSQCSQVY